MSDRTIQLGDCRFESCRGYYTIRLDTVLEKFRPEFQIIGGNDIEASATGNPLSLLLKRGVYIYGVGRPVRFPRGVVVAVGRGVGVLVGVAVGPAVGVRVGVGVSVGTGVRVDVAAGAAVGFGVGEGPAVGGTGVGSRDGSPW